MAQLETTAEPSLELDQELDLDTLYRAHSAVVSKWIRRHWGPARPEAEIEDLLHEVFLVVERRLSTFRSEAALTTWLYSITVRVVTARRRKERWRSLLWRRAELELELEDSEPASSKLARSEVASQVYAVLDELSERDRTLLILFELEHLPGAEVARILGVAERNVWVALTRARARFKTTFVRRYGDVEANEEGATHG